MRSNRSLFQGAKASLPIVFGYLPIGIAYGMMARQAGLSFSMTLSFSLFVYAGAAQMAAVGMLSQGMNIFSIIFTTWILNLRHIMMSTVVMNKMRDGSFVQRVMLSLGMTDEVFAVYTTDSDPSLDRFYLLGLSLCSYVSWVFASFLGLILTSFLPEMIAQSLSISLYAMFIALLVPTVQKQSRLLVVVLSTMILNVLCSQLFSSSIAMIFSTLGGAGVGMFLWKEEEDV